MKDWKLEIGNINFLVMNKLRLSGIKYKIYLWNKNKLFIL
jgi:hypothetical protein